MMKKFKRNTIYLLIPGLIIFLASCFGNKANIPEFPMENGRITGEIFYSFSDTPLEDVEISIDVRGETYKATSNPDGTFSLDTGIVKRGEGYTVHFKKDNFNLYSKAAIFDLPNFRVDLGKVTMADLIEGSYEPRKITGKVIDNSTSTPEDLGSVVVTVQNSNGETLSAQSDASGAFEINGRYLVPGSQYVLTFSKNYFFEKSNVTVDISGLTSVINATPADLYRMSGKIAGIAMDDDTGKALQGASISAVDGKGCTVNGITDRNGKFRLSEGLKDDNTTPCGKNFFLGRDYTVLFTKDYYHGKTTTAYINLIDDNDVDETPLKIMIDSKITGTVQNKLGGAPLEGVYVSTTDSNGDLKTDTTDPSGKFTLSGTGFRKDKTYDISFSLDGYELNSGTTNGIQSGNNILTAIELEGKPNDGYIITGDVKDIWNNNEIVATVSIKDADNVVRTATCNSSGEFNAIGNFIYGSYYDINVAASGYTGKDHMDKRVVNIKIETEDTQSAGTISMYPIGIRLKINGSDRTFDYDTKQSYEKFLTDKIGLTISGRDGTDLNATSTFYIHVDEESGKQLPGAPDGVYSTLVPINGGTVSGALVHGIESEEASRPGSVRSGQKGQKPSSFGMFGCSMYHFYVSTSADFVIETYGSTNTKLVLYNENHTKLAEENYGSSYGDNAKISVSSLSPGWYFVAVDGYDDNEWGFFELDVKASAPQLGYVGTWSTNNLILSYYDGSAKTIYVAGYNETNSSGSIEIEAFNEVNNLIRGNFTGTLRAINSAGTTIPVTSGYFNIIRSE